MFNYILYFDGCSKGNPGPSGAGAVLFSNSKEIGSVTKFVGVNSTNNEAEYEGLKLALQLALSKNIKYVTVKGDSLLIIKQIQQIYKVKAVNLIPYYKDCKKLEKQFINIKYEHVKRNFNKRADQLANEGLLKNRIINRKL